jgi:hypothetical protein
VAQTLQISNARLQSLRRQNRNSDKQLVKDLLFTWFKNMPHAREKVNMVIHLIEDFLLARRKENKFIQTIQNNLSARVKKKSAKFEDTKWAIRNNQQTIQWAIRNNQQTIQWPKEQGQKDKQ